MVLRDKFKLIKGLETSVRDCLFLRIAGATAAPG